MLALPVVLLGPAPSQGAPAPTATQIRVTDVRSPDISVPVAEGTPAIFAAVGSDLTVDVVLEDAAGVQLPASYNKDTVLTIAVRDGATATSLASDHTTSVVLPAGASQISFTGVRFTAAANGVTLQVSGPPARNRNDVPLVAGVSGTMDVQSAVVTAPGTNKLTSIGPADTSGVGCAASPEQKVCADLLLPNGSAGGQLLSLGACDGSGTATDCPTDRSVVQALANLAGKGYDRTHPATLVMKCDKASCGGGSLQALQLNVSLSATGALAPAPACPAKGAVGSDQEYCVDYVQSTRDNAGDSILYLLFIRDARATFR